MLFRTYDKSGANNMSFDLFVQSCIILKRMTDVFKKYDDDRDGYITLSFEEFLTGMFDYVVSSNESIICKSRQSPCSYLNANSKFS